MIWDRLDKVRAKHPDMVLVHGGSPKGAELIASKWATTRKVPQIAFKPDWTKHAKAAPFKRNDAMLELLPIGVMHFPGTGIQDNLADKAKRLGIPVWKFGAAHKRRLPPSDATQAELHTPQLRRVSIAYPNPRRGGGGRRDRYTFAHGATTMLALGLLLNTVGIGLFCWLIFTLAVYALPFFVAINAGIWAFHSGAGPLGTPLVAIAAGGMTLAIAQIAFAMTRSLILRAVIAALFALPATLAGYHVALAMAQIGVPSLVWREVFACLGAVFIGGTAWTRLAVFTGRPDRSNRAGRSATVLSQFSRPPHARDDLFILVVEQVRVNRRRTGVVELERK